MNNTVRDELQKYEKNIDARKSEFFRYYSNKRIQHQLMQLSILKDVSGNKLTEVGSYLGFATALFCAVGFKVQTIDDGSVEVLGEITPQKHISKNITEIEPEDFSGQDVIVCCETLEHLPYSDAEKTLQIFYDADVEWLLISVPYRCTSIDVRWAKNPFSSFFSWIVKLPTKQFREFVPDPEPHGHKWELGYKKSPLKKLKNTLEKIGFCVTKTEYVGTVQSVFLLARRQ